MEVEVVDHSGYSGLRAIVAAVISLQMPKVYEISVTIEPGVGGVKDDGSFLYIDSVANISGKIDKGIYNRMMEKTLKSNLLNADVNFESTIVKGTNMINITSQWQERDTDLGVKAAGELVRLLVGDYERIIEHRKAISDGQIASKLSDIKKFETKKNCGKRLRKISSAGWKN